MCCLDKPRPAIVALRDTGPGGTSRTGDGVADLENDVDGVPLSEPFLSTGLVTSARTNTEPTVMKNPKKGDQERMKLAALASTRHSTHSTGTEHAASRRSHIRPGWKSSSES